ncbi:MAG TPA: FKBP-type peptidyl-prolyl cis-trans isomerase [Lacunisphaera sp.]
MNRFPVILLCGLVILAAGCGPKEVEPAVPAVDEAALRHEKLFGVEAKTPGITWRSSGLGVLILIPGEGAPPKMSDKVRVNYVGKLKDGQVFADSHTTGKPADFVVNQLITGWAAAMTLLKPGSHAKLFIPPALGYGGMNSAKIPANSGLIFDVELLVVNPESAPKS